MEDTLQIERTLGEIFDSFASHKKIHLPFLKKQIQSRAGLKQTQFFLELLTKTIEQPPVGCQNLEMDRKSFCKFFSQPWDSQSKFQTLFSCLDDDNSGFVSKKQLLRLAKENGLVLKESEAALMIDMASSDGQKVTRRQLFQFLNTEQ